MTTVISMDPGDNTGIVIWKHGKPVDKKFWKLKAKEKQLPPAEQQAILTKYFLDFLTGFLKGNPPQVRFVIEGVSLWGNSAKSQASALRGNSFELAYLVGGYINTFQNVYPEGGVILVDVRTWKGNLPTPVLFDILKNKFKIEPENEHLACAYGIGLWHLGRL